jgi:hypothetical protein
MAIFKKLLPYFLASFLVIGFWLVETSVDNYAWSPTGDELMRITKALKTIFILKTIFWLTITNSVIFIVQQLRQKNYKIVSLTVMLSITFFLLGRPYIAKCCAYPYFIVFTNQSVVEWSLQKPINEAGYYIGPILTEKILDKQLNLRRYAIGGLVNIGYKPATNTLNKILLDKTEPDEIRADAYSALAEFDTKASRQAILNFKAQAKDTVDRNVVELGEYFHQHK